MQCTDLHFFLALITLVIYGYFWIKESMEFLNEVINEEAFNNMNIATSVFAFIVIIGVGCMWWIRAVTTSYYSWKKRHAK